MAKQSVRKVTSKSTTQPPAAILSKSEQDQINKDWEQENPGVNRGGQNINVTQDYYNEWGGKGSSLGTNASRGGSWKSGLGAGVLPSQNTSSSSGSKEIGKLPIKKLTTLSTKTEPQKIQKTKYSTPIEIKYKKEPKVKAMSKGGKPLQRLAKNVKTTAKNIVGPAKFKREEKLAGAYERQKAGLEGTSKEKAAQLQKDRKYLRSKEMRKTGQGTTLKSKMERAKTLSGARKDLRQAEKYVKKEAKGKIKYFTQDAMNKREQLTLDEMKKRKSKNQAGKTRYSS